MSRALFRPKERIGLLGGSFNPAHGGHIHLSLEAKRRLKLDRIVWLLSPQNPLKSTQGMAPYETRLTFAQSLTQPQHFISVSNYEKQNQLYYSLDTITALQHDYPKTHFVWLMGADNLVHFHQWRGWRSIMTRIPVAVFDRAPFPKPCDAAACSPLSPWFSLERPARANAGNTPPTRLGLLLYASSSPISHRAA